MSVEELEMELENVEETLVMAEHAIQISRREQERLSAGLERPHGEPWPKPESGAA